MDRFLPIPFVKMATISGAWREALRKIVSTGYLVGEVVDQRGDRTYEVLGLQAVVTDPLRGMIPKLPKIPGVTAWGDKARLDEYFETEILGFDEEGNKVPKPEGFEYVYADYIYPALPRVLHVLQHDDPSTRRATIPVGWCTDQLSESPPCLRSVQFLIRRGKLDMITTWRSRDYAGAAATNMYGLIRLQDYVAQTLGIPVGRYIDFSSSAHIRIKDDLWWVEKVIA